MKIINLTPHSITIGAITIPGTNTPARCDTITEPFYVQDCPVPVVRQSFGDVHGLPDPAPSTIYIVSMPVAQAVGRSRDDVFVPGEQIRDETGRIVGCRSIAVLRQIPPIKVGDRVRLANGVCGNAINTGGPGTVARTNPGMTEVLWDEPPVRTVEWTQDLIRVAEEKLKGDM